MIHILSQSLRRGFIASGALFLVGAIISPTTGRAASPEEAKAERDVFTICTKILSYGDVVQYYKPSKKDAVIALGLLGDEKALPILIEHLQNEKNNDLRLNIVRALGWIGSTRAVPALEEALHDSYPHVRKQAAMALKEMTGKDYEYDKTGLADYRRSRDVEPADADRK